jgi:hypothetical protein
VRVIEIHRFKQDRAKAPVRIAKDTTLSIFFWWNQAVLILTFGVEIYKQAIDKQEKKRPKRV